MCILLTVGGKATVVPIPDESLPDESGHQAARPRDLRHVRAVLAWQEPPAKVTQILEVGARSRPQ
jgi:hypothetical protein